MNQNMKVEKGFTFITECGQLVFVYKKFKNGRSLAYAFGGDGVEEIEYEYDEEDILRGKDSNLVYGVMGGDKKIIKDQTSFYFDKNLAKGVANELNKHICSKDKFKAKKYYLIDFNL